MVLPLADHGNETLLGVTARFSVHASLKYEHTAADQNESNESLEGHLKGKLARQRKI